ncbi:class I SAM-dependent methyltransferase [bacterium]|jgi:hypothetical protein|nr:class I SAM-dependent methyltransferase [bacterium]
MKIFENELISLFPNTDKGVLFNKKVAGYWSNIEKAENKKLIDDLDNNSTETVIQKYLPHLTRVIFSNERSGGLELLNLTGNETCIDYGCMWGGMTIPLSKRTKTVVGVDQTLESLKFLNHRAQEENQDNIILINEDIKEFPCLENKVDIAIINGVLEWVPEHGSIELSKYYGKFSKKNYKQTPIEIQKNFLKKVHNNLSSNGQLYLAIENRYDLNMFIGLPDPHSNLKFTSILPRRLANLVSKALLGRPYVTWIYSFNKLKKLLIDSGFSDVELYMCFPNYRFPKKILPYDSQHLSDFHTLIPEKNDFGKTTIKRRIRRKLENFIFRTLKMKFFSPSIIAIAKQ